MTELDACPFCGSAWKVVSSSRKPMVENQTLTVYTLACGHDVKIYGLEISGSIRPEGGVDRLRMKSGDKTRGKPRREVKSVFPEKRTEKRISVERGDDSIDTEVVHDVWVDGENVHHHRKKEKGKPGE